MINDIHVLDTEERWDSTNEDEASWWPRVLWIDPGTVSGVACVWFDPQAVFGAKPMAKQILAYSQQLHSGDELGQNGTVSRFVRVARTSAQTPGLAVGIESFTPRQLNMSYEFLSPVRIGAAISWGLSVGKPPIVTHYQAPVDALRTFANDRLRTLRMYTTGPDHVNDAKRHCLLWIRKLTDVSRERFAELHGDESGWWE